MRAAGRGKEKPTTAFRHQSTLSVFGLSTASTKAALSGPFFGGGETRQDVPLQHNLLRRLAEMNTPPKPDPAKGTAALSPAPTEGVRSRLLAAAKHFRRPWGLSRGGSASCRSVFCMACLRLGACALFGKATTRLHFSRRNIRADRCSLPPPRLGEPRRHAGGAHLERPARLCRSEEWI